MEYKEDWVEAHFHRGVAYGSKGAHERAIADFTKVIALDPGSVVAYYNRAEACKEIGEYDRAIADYTDAIRLKPEWAPPYRGRAEVRQTVGDLDKALLDRIRVVELAPHSPEAHFGLAKVYWARGDAGAFRASFVRGKWMGARGAVAGSPTAPVKPLVATSNKETPVQPGLPASHPTQTAIIAEGDAARRLEGSFSQEYVCIELVDAVPDATIYLKVHEFSFEDRFLRHRATLSWSCPIRSADSWAEVAAVLSKHARLLVGCVDWFARDGNRSLSRTPYDLSWTALLYQVPHRRTMKLDRSTEVVLSAKAQQHLYLSAVSEHRASRNVLIIGEPHGNVEEQVALLQGLEVLLADNPQLLEDNRLVFLAEAYPAGKRISIQPLVQANPNPGNQLLREVLASFLITGYIDYEWKHQHGIPILGTEDPELYKTSAQALLLSTKRTEKRCDAYSLHMVSVGARNERIAHTLLEQLKGHACPVLFVGRGHVGYGTFREGSLIPSPTRKRRELCDAAWQRFGQVVDAASLDRLKQARSRSIREFLEERGVGFYFLEARGDPMPDAAAVARQRAQYHRLLQAQLNQTVDAYVQTCAGQRRELTVSPSADDAAMLVRALTAMSTPPPPLPPVTEYLVLDVDPWDTEAKLRARLDRFAALGAGKPTDWRKALLSLSMKVASSINDQLLKPPLANDYGFKTGHVRALRATRGGFFVLGLGGTWNSIQKYRSTLRAFLRYEASGLDLAHDWGLMGASVLSNFGSFLEKTRIGFFPGLLLKWVGAGAQVVDSTTNWYFNWRFTQGFSKPGLAAKQYLLGGEQVCRTSSRRVEPYQTGNFARRWREV